MTTLTQLIEHHCPNGVEYVELKEVLKYEQPGKYLVSSTDYDDGFSTAVLTAGKTFILGYTDETTGIYEASPDDPVIIFDDFTTAFKWVDFPFKAKSSAMKMLTPAEVDSSFRYIFYAMHDVDVDVTDHKRQWIRTYSKEKIPLPPYEVQDAIVERLDAFAALIESLDSEITLREKRFEYFREQLLNFDESDGVDFVLVCDAFKFVKTAKGIKRSNYSSLGKYPVVDQGAELIAGYTDHELSLHGDYVVFGDHTRSVKWVDFPFVVGADGTKVLRSVDGILPKFSYYCMSNLQIKNLGYSRHWKIVNSMQIPLPPLEVQHDIVDKLDSMQALIDNLKQERELRKAQFEYYREKLLTFNS